VEATADIGATHIDFLSSAEVDAHSSFQQPYEALEMTLKESRGQFELFAELRQDTIPDQPQPKD